jgi:hypothetical protein
VRPERGAAKGAHPFKAERATVAMMIECSRNENDKRHGLSVSAIRSRYQTTLRCFSLTGEVLSGQGVREAKSLSGEYTGAERK